MSHLPRLETQLWAFVQLWHLPRLTCSLLRPLHVVSLNENLDRTAAAAGVSHAHVSHSFESHPRADSHLLAVDRSLGE